MKEEQIVEILLIEDNAYDAEMTIRALQVNNLADHVVWIKDGEAAEQYLFGDDVDAAGRPDRLPRLVLLDLKLQKVDGLEILRRLKSHDETRAIPVVVLTSSREARDIVESYRFGVNSYIVKPVSFERFNEAVRQVGLYWLLLNQVAGVSLSVKKGEGSS